jgi:hypothetical protein
MHVVSGGVDVVIAAAAHDPALTGAKVPVGEVDIAT